MYGEEPGPGLPYGDASMWVGGVEWGGDSNVDREGSHVTSD